MVHDLQYSFASRLNSWIKHLKAAEPCESQQGAYALVIENWVRVNSDMGAPPQFLQALRRRRLCEEHGWHGVGTNVAYWDLDDVQSVRIYLHDDGTIVVQQMDADNLQILFTLPGRVGALNDSLLSERGDSLL